MLILDTHALYWWVNRTPEKMTQVQLLSVDKRFPEYQELAGLLARM